jgi:hypothetical protein
LTNTCPSGFTCSLNKNSVVISPGITDSSTTITLTLSSGATGTYSFSVTATSSSYTGTGSASYVISSTTITKTTFNIHVQNSSQKSLSGADVLLIATFPAGGTVPWEGYTDANGNITLSVPIDQLPIISWSVTLSGYVTQSGSGSPPSIVTMSKGGTGGTTNQINFKTGWNMFSLPLDATINSDYIRSQCGSTNKIWNYNPVSQLYEEAIQILPGKGYWFKVNSVCTVSVTGSDVQSIPGLKVGWNQVGTFSQTVTFNTVKGNCNVLSGPWKYNPVSLLYESSTTLDPSYGYWVKVSSNCDIGYGGPPPPP